MRRFLKGFGIALLAFAFLFIVMFIVAIITAGIVHLTGWNDKYVSFCVIVLIGCTIFALTIMGDLQ